MSRGSELRARKERLPDRITPADSPAESLFDLAPLAYFTLNSPEFTIDQVNQAGATLLGRERAALQGQPLELFVESGSRPILAELLGSGGPREKTCKLELTGVGGQSTQVLLHVGRVPSGDRLLLAATDLTPLHDSTEELLRAARLEVSATLAAGVAHDLNNLMASVLGNADDLLADAAPGTKAKDSLHHIIEAARRASSLAQQMLAYARGGKYHPAPANLNHILADVLHSQNRSRPSRILIEQRLDPGLAEVEADTMQMSEVLLCLHQNACESISGKGRIIFTTTNLDLDETQAHKLPPLHPGPHVTLSVQDNGCGIDPSIISLIFEPFYSTKATGRGLSLAAAQGVLENHGGRFTVASQVGRGSTFTLYLPARSPGARLEPPSSLQVSDDPGATVLIVDDDAAVLRITSLLLERLGYRALVASTAEKAMELAVSESSSIRAVLLDLIMPGTSGSELFPVLQQALPGVAIGIFSGYELDSTAEAIMDAGACLFLHKPFDRKALEQTIAQLLTETQVRS